MTTPALANSVLLAAALLSGTALAESFPAKPVSIVVGATPGSGPDTVARIVADRLQASWKQPVVILNRGGAGGLIGMQAISTAKPDGYTLYLPVASTYTVLPETAQEKLPLDLQRDIVPIGLVGEQPMVIAVASSLGVNTLQQLIALGRSRPGELTYGAGRGGMPHLALELLSARAGVQFTFVPYAGGVRQVVAEMLGGRISLTADSISALSGALERGGIKLLAVASASRLPDYPDLPTVSETLPGYEARGWFVLAAPAATPAEILRKVNRDLYAALEQPELMQKLRALGTYTKPLQPDELADFVRNEQELWKPVVMRMGLAAQ